MISDKSANVLVGPITFPNPGPTLARDVAAPDKEVKKSFPRKDRRSTYDSLDRKRLYGGPITKTVPKPREPRSVG